MIKNKTAIINAAQKFASKGLIDKAIAEWEKLLLDRKDGNIHNTIGDLYLRKGADEEAVKSFNKAAEIFRKDGFYPKAIAIYKKVLNIEPNDVDALIALAKLHADKGLTGNAIDNYYRAAEIYNKDGATEKATLVVEKMLQLSPADTSTRSKIAYLYFRIGLREKAATEYAAIALTFLERDNIEKAKEFFDTAIEYDPGNVSALMGLSELALKENNNDHAFELLNNARSQDPENRNILVKYAQLAMDADRNDEAREALALLTDQDPSHGETRRLLGTFHLKEGLIEEAWDELLPVIDDVLDAEKWTEAQELLGPFKDLHIIPAKERLIRLCRARGDDHALPGELAELASLHENQGAVEDAIPLYKEALALHPDNNALREKINELEISSEAAPEHNEVTFPGMDIAAEGHPPAEETGSAPAGDGDTFAFPQTEEPYEEQRAGDNAYVQNASEPGSPLSEDMEITSEDDFSAKKVEADFYAQQGLDEEAVKMYEALLSARPDDDEIARKLASLKSAGPETVDLSVEQIKEEPDTDTEGEEDLQALFDQFEAPEDKTEDYEARYIAGLECKQKGFLDEAIEELQIAARDPDKIERNTTMLALCYMEKGSYPLAIAAFNRIIDSMTPSNSTYLYVKYELANAYQYNKEERRALELYSEIKAQDPEFKDVSVNVERLEQQIGSSRDTNPARKRDRVSYI